MSSSKRRNIVPGMRTTTSTPSRLRPQHLMGNGLLIGTNGYNNSAEYEIRRPPPSAQRSHSAPRPSHMSAGSPSDVPSVSSVSSSSTSRSGANCVHHRQPLILDAKNRTPQRARDTPSGNSGVSSSEIHIGMMSRLLSVAKTHTKRRSITNFSSTRERLASSMEQTSGDPAATFARSAPKAGFLMKLGRNIPEYKRRFFVLKPTTHLYYFLSPADVEPRGCIDLEGTSLENVEELPDGRVRFDLKLRDENRIGLEARSQEVAQEWIDCIKKERLTYCKGQLSQECIKRQGLEARIAELETQVEEMRLVERDRDGAIQDALRWRLKYETLDEALRTLTDQVRRPPDTDDVALTEDKGAIAHDDQNAAIEEGKTENDNPDMTDTSNGGHAVPDNSLDETDESENESSSPSRNKSLLDDIGDEEKHFMEQMDLGSAYSALANACQQLRENLKLASVEASAAVEDLTTANEKVSTMESRMARAEKHLCKLWEENCAMRETLKQKKREKKVLVREVRQLLTVAQSNTKQRLEKQCVPKLDLIDSDEQNLGMQLEEQVRSLRLHEELLSSERGRRQHTRQGERRPPSRASSTSVTSSGATVRIRNIRRQRTSSPLHFMGSESNMVDKEADGSRVLSPLQPARLSLMDSDDDATDRDNISVSSELSSTGTEIGESKIVIEPEKAREKGEKDTHEIEDLPSSDANDEDTDSVVLNVEGISGCDELCKDQKGNMFPSGFNTSQSEYETRKHPLVKLDEDDSATTPTVCPSSSQSESSKSVVTDHSQPTSRLECPLKDVSSSRGSPPKGEDGKMYHLTFYGKKIGIQFQKVPASSTSRGVLTAAMTADVPAGSSGQEGATTAELRRIAEFSQHLNDNPSNDDANATCPVATPVDAVLVCGFHGFDDSSNNVRPKLGARLVAFDGVSVEVGRWTFESVRNSIQARGRPLTLSFRNDYLTTQQRAILTKAVVDVESSIPPPRPIVQYRMKLPRTPNPSVSLFPEKDRSDAGSLSSLMVNSSPVGSIDSMGPMYSHSIGRSASYMSQDHSGPHELPSTMSSTNFRSFSDAGSSSVFSTSLGPLMANLMSNLGEGKPEASPGYLQRRQAVEEVPDHQHFEAGLL